MGCSPAGNKTFLVVCNIGLLFLGLTILSLGVKMQTAIEALRLEGIPLLMNAIKGVVATGFFITVTGGAGFCGSCYEIMWLILVHLAGLGLIVVLEFSLGVTLMVIKTTVEAALIEANCGKTCYNIVMFVVTKLASASAGTMFTVIIIEALMIYSAVQMYYYLRSLPKIPPAPVAIAGPTVVVQNVQMQNMAAPAPANQPLPMTAPFPQHAQHGLQPSYMAPPPPYSQAQAEQSQDPHYSNPVPQQNQPPAVSPLDTSTSKGTKGDV